MDTRSSAGNVPQPARHKRGPAPRKTREMPSAGNGGNGFARKSAQQLALREQDLDLYGALDLGTNNCRLLLAIPSPTGFTVVDAFSRIVRLGEGTSLTGKLSEQAMLRTVSALRVCANKLKWWNVPRFRLIATEACRVAENGFEFLDRVEQETGLALEIVDRETEARLAVAGAAPLIDTTVKTVLVFDIGGGSTEITWLTINAGRHTLERWVSIPVGVVTIAELFGGKEVSAGEFRMMREHVRPRLQEFAGVLRDASFAPVPGHLLGTSGTVTTICGVHLNLKRYDRSKVDGCWLQTGDIERVTAELLSMPYDERALSPCIGRERADLVLAGCAILEEIRTIWPAGRIRVADRGLREGILAKMMMEDGVYDRSE